MKTPMELLKEFAPEFTKNQKEPNGRESPALRASQLPISAS